MIRSLYSGVSGMRSHQTRMDVVGSNIANVNTIGFKSSRVTFAQLLGQSLLGSGRGAVGGSINPAQIGLGVAVASIDRRFTQGSFESTNIASDVALDGPGFFVLRKDKEIVLTRAGNFQFNNRGELVNVNGFNVQGWTFQPRLDASGNIQRDADGRIIYDLNRKLTDIRLTDYGVSEPKETQLVRITGNLNASLPPYSPTQPEAHTISTVIYDAQGVARTMIVEFRRTGASQWDALIRVQDNAGGFLNIGQPTGAVPADTDTDADTVTVPLQFDAQGRLIPFGSGDSRVEVEFDPDGPGPLGNQVIQLDLGSLVQYEGASTARVESQDGFPKGDFVTFRIDSHGILEVLYSNGQRRPIAQLAVGDVPNQQGLEHIGDGIFRANATSGPIVFYRASEDTATTMVSGALEMSNVDLASEFTDMIVTQRGFQASARIITTSDEMLQETVQLKR
ncbi:MAG: flagellar hook protein FlgE [Bacteroidetes bacterium]|nr:flagellar hook protein FlgE [Rhodothermia bacterium]MCS7154673.1 flagellar hook protein FlgE [Bacteroidota bacterium]MCX7906390.1 flagellar hook protein FlgE [Bacteroidota bacterium]MDW8137466.1 flagellar hook protein FlgE [Bacteroidota bacterium]MDW8285580.1 flagellar hook protein FlgE [Bacteroidota bacterium]